MLASWMSGRSRSFAVDICSGTCKRPDGQTPPPQKSFIFFFSFFDALFRLAYQSVGVIVGDIGTSPLYVYSSTFSSSPSYDDLLGALSLIIWTITLMVSVKYVIIVLRADDEGEGGTFAIYSLLSKYVRRFSVTAALGV